MLSEGLLKLLENREFISVATCDFKGRPNAAPKFLLKAGKSRIYLVDYTIGTTWRNLKTNPRTSLSFIDPATLKGYQLNGAARIIDKGREYDRMFNQMQDKEIRLTTKHIIEDVRGMSRHDNFEVVITEKFVVLEVKIEEVVEIGIRGELKRCGKKAKK